MNLKVNHLMLGICGFTCLFAFYKLRIEQRILELQEQIYVKMSEEQFLKNNTAVKLGSQLESDLLDAALKRNKKIIKICITGGPCAGKTTGLSFLQKKLKERGFEVFNVPEAATQIFLGGGMLDLTNYSKEGKATFQMNLMKLQMDFENTFQVLASLCQNESPILLCDRGLMDGKAYMEAQDWYDMLAQYNLNEVNLRDQRYEAIVHLVTAADNTDCYSTLNNSARHETQEEAIKMDQRTQQAWVGHPNYIKIDNHNISSFQEKLNWLLFEILKLLGYPVEGTVFGKTKLLLVKLRQQFQDNNVIELTNIYLIPKNSNSTLKLVKRIVEGHTSYYIKEKIFNQDKVVIKVNSKSISKSEFITFTKFSDPKIQTIKRKRTCYSYEGQYMIFDEFIKPSSPVVLLKLKTAKENYVLPPFIDVIQNIDISEEKYFRCREIAYIDSKEDEENPLFRKFRKHSATDSSEHKPKENNNIPSQFDLNQQQQEIHQQFQEQKQ